MGAKVWTMRLRWLSWRPRADEMTACGVGLLAATELAAVGQITAGNALGGILEMADLPPRAGDT